MLGTTGDQRRVSEERDVGADVLDEVVVSDDLLCKPVELATCVHSCGTHVVEGLDRWDEAQAVGQCSGLVLSRTPGSVRWHQTTASPW